MTLRNYWPAALLVLATPLLHAATAAKTTNASTTARAATAVPKIDIPYTKFTLKNGLTLIVHEDHKAPIVAVNVWYHVGSKNEPQSRSGFAHLFEHLMFNGSENFNKDYFQAVERIGATDLNGTTNEDRTNYFQNVPTSALDTVLWLESDRMGHLVSAIDQPRLDEQRGVVQNEKRQGENQPYAIAEELITKAVFPANHPYSHTVIGSMEDLNAAKLDDVKEWFKTYYGPSNAVLVVAGDIDPATAKAKVEKYFGDIPPGPPVAHFEEWVAKRSGSQKQRAEDRVPAARLYKVWNVPGVGTEDAAYLDLLSDVLFGDKGSRLYKRLIYDDQIATSAGAGLDSREIGSLFQITATARPQDGGDLSKIEAAVDEELHKLIANGVTQDELDRVRTQYFARFVRGAERIGGFGGKSDVLASSQTFNGSPDAYKKTLNWIANAKPADLNRVAKQWLTDGVFDLEVVPFANFAAVKTGAADRSKLPEPSASPEPIFPAAQRAKLSNGVNVVVAERHDMPIVNIALTFDAGTAADQGTIPGTASLTMNMLDEGTTSRNSLAISEDLARLGATLNTGANLDMSTISMSTLKTTLDSSLGLMADVLLHPSFPDADLARLKKLQIAQIQREKSQPVQAALRVLPTILYGANHAYAGSLNGTGTEESVPRITRADLVKYHDTWLRPNNATVIVVGDTTLAEMQPKLEKLFAGWSGGSIPKKNITTATLPAKPSVYLIDKPGAIQSVLVASVLAPPKANPMEQAIEAMDTVLGGAFISRLNMNLREDKHWSYGATSFVNPARAQRIFLAYSPVQSDKTKESLVEMSKELKQIVADKVITADEAAMAKANLTLTLPGSLETSNEVTQSLSNIVRYDLPYDYYQTYAGRVKALTVNDLNKAAQEVVRPENLTWVIVGDRAKIEQGIRDLNLGELHVIDADGKPVQ